MHVHTLSRRAALLALAATALTGCPSPKKETAAGTPGRQSLEVGFLPVT
jgi:hypothetical protein